jgi:hypothetical protein
LRYAFGMTRAAAARALPALFLSVLLGACSHTFFQFHLNAGQHDEVMQAQQALAVSARGDVNMLAQVVDLNGRRAVEVLVAGMTVEETAGDVQYQRLSRALSIGVMGDASDPLSMLDPDLTTVAARVGQRVAANQLGQMGFGGIASMVGVVPYDSGTRLREMQASLVRGRVDACRELHPVISYDAGILGHIRSQLAEQDPVYLEWRGRVRAIHLVRLSCQSGHALMIFTKNHGEAGVRAIGWHFLTPQQWQALEPGLRHALDLPPS